jgi:excisionase family DNA binding protein
MSGVITNSDLARGDWHEHRKSEGDEPTSAGAVSDERRSAIMEKRTLTDIEVATRLGVSRFTVRSWRLKGIGPRFLKLGRAVRYRPEDVDEYVRQALIEPQTR